MTVLLRYVINNDGQWRDCSSPGTVTPSENISRPICFTVILEHRKDDSVKRPRSSFLPLTTL